MFLQNGQYPLGGFRGVLDRLPQAIVVFDSLDRIAFANRAATELCERTGCADQVVRPSDLLRKLGPLTDLDGTPLSPAEEPVARLDREESFCDLHLRSTRRWPDGRPVLSFSGHRISDSQTGEELRVLTIEDTSASYERESLFRTAFERGPVPVSLVRRSDECLMDVNQAFLELLGYDRSEVVGHTIPELAVLLGSEEVVRNHEPKQVWEEVERLELTVRRRDDSYITLLTWQCWVEVGGDDCLLGVYVDITEQKEMERKLREATQVVLESASVFSLSVVQQLERLRGPERATSVNGDFDLLTRRERQVVTRVGAGHSNLKIAAELALTPQTVRNYVTRIYRKIGVTNRAEAVVWARERGLVQG